MDNKAQWNEAEDSRKKGGMKYPHYNAMITSTGHKIITDDTKGQESITIEHRSGSLIQFQPDGSVVFHNKKNKQEIIFGDNQIIVTGEYDMTVNGGATMKIEGDMDMTVNGNMKQTIKGNLETIVDGSMSTAIADNQDTVVGGDSSIKVAGNSEVVANKLFVGSETDLALDAGGSTLIGADSNINLLASGDINFDHG
ncbi:MAG: hypothetical protein WD512_09960 [Candidatus Paceibacterota bacterium]